MMHRFFLILGGLAGLGMLGLPARADTLTELQSLLQRSRAVIHSNASIDEFNPEKVHFQTELTNQLVELVIHGERLNDAFVTAVNYAEGRRARAHSNVQFGDLRVLLDGCDVTAALVTQCNTNECWDVDPTVPHADFSGVFGTAIHLNLSVLNPTMIPGCAIPAPGFFAEGLSSHTLEFREGTTGLGKGGNLNYQVLVFQKAQPVVGARR
ncbi:MAG: hypothetical protein IT285_13845 [Bdellovibrionales bacterium]|nr:hypothetical protein [Bdellovibrionales bacterium]